MYDAVVSQTRDDEQTWLQQAAARHPELTLETCRVDLVRGVVHREDERVALTDMERALLLCLADGQTVSRSDLLRDVWGYAPTVRSRAVENSVWRLRKKIERNPDQAEHLLTVRGVGFRLLVAARESVDLVGRDDLLGQCRDLLGKARWLTLTGAPGVGKSAVARALGGASWWIDAGTDGVERVAAALGVELRHGPAMVDVVGRALSVRGAAVLVLDGVRPEAVGPIRRWLLLAPQLTVVATARRPLCDAGGGGDVDEQVVPIPTLDTSADGPAVELLWRQIARTGMTVTEADRASLHELAVTLDGLPLALCLAARRVQLLGLASVAQRAATDLATV